MKGAKILVVDDHREMTSLLADRLTDRGFDVVTAEAGAEAIALAKTATPDLVVTDLRMKDVDGLDVLEAVKRLDPSTPVIVMTAFGAIDSAIEAMRRGAFHYLTKPFELDALDLFIDRGLADRRLRDENEALREAARRRSAFGELAGESKPMRALFDLIARVARSSAPVLVRGESGSGKDLVARALHTEGARKDGAFVPVNCTALPETLLESELFGHVKGSFTGAAQSRRGLFVEADGGTLFLDEIGDMPLALQAKLLRVLEDGEVRSVGSDAPRKVDVRIVAASHRDLEQAVQEQKFRADLFFRLNVVPVRVPPLREHPEDVPILVDRFLARARERNPAATATRFDPAVVAAFAKHPWPGNVRELENVVERLVVVATGPAIGLDDVRAHAPSVLGESEGFQLARSELVTLRRLESEYIAYVIRRCDGNKTRAAEILGIDVSTIHRREKDKA